MTETDPEEPDGVRESTENRPAGSKVVPPGGEVRSWLRSHSAHVYGAGGVLLGLASVVATVMYSSVEPGSDNEHDGFRSLREREIAEQVRQMRGSDPDVIQEVPEGQRTAANAPDLDFSAFTLLEEAHVWDLRRWQSVRLADRQRPMSPSVLKTRVRLRKVEPVDYYYVPAFSSGLDIFSRSDSHPENFRIELGPDRVAAGQILKARYLRIDVSEEPLNQDFPIEITRTYWNGMQDETGTWIGTTVRQAVLKISFLVVMPETRRFTDYELLVNRLGEEERYPYGGNQLVIEDPAGRYLFWEITDPEPDHIYLVDWDW